MDKLAFLPFVDLPLAVGVVATFVWHCSRWSLRRNLDTNVDLRSRLPRARLRVIALFVCLLLLCWWIDLAFWSLLAALLAVGLVVTALGGGDIEGGAFGLLAAAYLIREWAFGFPQLILHPQSIPVRTTESLVALERMVGQMGLTTTPLRPSGKAEFDGIEYSAVSHDGVMIDPGIKVVVTASKNGSLCVAVAPGAQQQQAG